MRGRIILVGGLFAALVGGQAFAQDIAGSPHDLASGSAANEDKNEICVYCHTPHGADNTVGPLWNKNAGTATLTSYDSTTIDGDILTVGSVSIACLSCHDGSQAPDSVINAPGTGLGDGQIGTLTALTGVAAVGADDLVNDHPIGIEYGGFDPGSGQIDPDFVAPQTALIGTNNVWWVDTGAGGVATREKTDMILYTRDNSGNPGGLAEEPFVECASCHDPHVGAVADAGTNLPGSDISFMRISNENSDVCLACHVK